MKYISVILGFVFLHPTDLHAFGFSSSELQSNIPIQLDATGGVTCDRDQGKCVARGNVVVRRGEAVLKADTVTAWLTQSDQKNMEIRRLEAEGHVHIYSEVAPREAFADKAIYETKEERVRLTGHALRLRLDNIFIYADDALEYRQNTLMALAEGNATAIQADKLIRADQLVAHLKEGKGKNLDIHKIDANGRVVISTPVEYVEGAHGTYNALQKVATLWGNVKITRCEGQMTGSVAHVNLETGESEIKGLESNVPETGQQVKVFFAPQKRNTDETH